MDKSQLKQKHMKNALFARVCLQKVLKMFTICTDACLEMLSSLVSCNVSDILSEIGPYLD